MDQKGITDIEIYQCSYTWEINNFKFMIDKKLATITSPTFTVTAGKDKMVWFLSLYINKEPNPSDLGIYLNFATSDKEEVFANYKISIINNKDKEMHTNESNGSTRFDGAIKSWGWRNFIAKSDILNANSDLFLDGKLRIFCQVSVLGDILIQPPTIQFKVPDCQLSDDFGVIFDSKKFSDATLSVIGGKEFQVHTTILAARSPVFAAMFNHDMEERKQNCVNINDVDYEVMHEVLKFIYTGKAENLETMACEILIAANKYALERLKILCEKELCKNFSIENAAEMLILSDIHNANQLKVQAIDFINTNLRVIETAGWKKLKQTHPSLIADIYEKLAQKIQKIHILESPQKL